MEVIRARNHLSNAEKRALLAEQPVPRRTMTTRGGHTINARAERKRHGALPRVFVNRPARGWRRYAR